MIGYIMQICVNWIADDRWTRVRDQALPTYVYMYYKKGNGRKQCHKFATGTVTGQSPRSSPATGCTSNFNNDNQSWSQQPQSSHHDHLAVSAIEWFHLFFSQTMNQVKNCLWECTQQQLRCYAPKWKRRHCDEITITGCTGSYHFDNLQCGQRRKSKKLSLM